MPFKTYREIIFGSKDVPMYGADYNRGGLYNQPGGAVEWCFNLWYFGATLNRDGSTRDSVYADGTIHNGGAAARSRWIQTGSCLYAEEI